METYNNNNNNHQQDNNNNNNIQDYYLVNNNNKNNNNGNVNVNGNGCSRQSSSRWTPTSDQIRILKELYYNNGIRSPTADQIQRIAAQLRHYGKIEGKNVFYWFQNHKARERQKKRFIPPPQASHFSDHHHHHLPPAAAMHYHHQDPPPPSHNVYAHPHKLYTTHHIGVGSSSSQGMMAVGCGYGSSVAMEKSFRECSISPPGENRGGNFRSSRDSFSLFDKLKPTTTYHHHHPHDEINMENHLHQELIKGEMSSSDDQTIETLPLFPIHDFFGIKTTASSTDHATAAADYCYRADARASLELSLNSSYAYYN